MGELPWEQLHAPLNKDKPAAISHFLICATESTPAGSGTEDGEEQAGTDDETEQAGADGEEAAAESGPSAAANTDDEDFGEVLGVSAADPRTTNSKKDDLPRTGGGAEAGLAVVGSLLIGAGAMLVRPGGGAGRHRTGARSRGTHRRG